MIDTSKAVFRKSSYSPSGNNCVEVAAVGSRFALRDSKDPDGPVLVFDSTDVVALVEDLKR